MSCRVIRTRSDINPKRRTLKGFSRFELTASSIPISTISWRLKDLFSGAIRPVDLRKRNRVVAAGMIVSLPLARNDARRFFTK